jgi:frataxin
MLDESQFRKASDEALTRLQHALERASETHEFDVDRKEGALTVEFEEPPARFVVSPNAPVRQIWVSALMRSFKLDWNESRSVFALSADGRDLHQLIADAIHEQTGEAVAL